jgi:hypothetical protein
MALTQASLACEPVAQFFIDTDTGQVASLRQLAETGVTPPGGLPPRPWHPVRGTGDASTMWYAVLRKQVKGVYIGTLALRHSDHHASLLQAGWQEVPVEEIAAVTGETPATNIFTQEN